MIENNFATLLARKKLDKSDIVKMTGLDNHTINKIYKNKTTKISFSTLNKLCYALECTIDDIFSYIPD